MNLLNSCVLLLQFFKIFLFFFYVFHYITKLQTEIQGPQITFSWEVVKTFRKDLALELSWCCGQETKLQNMEFIILSLCHCICHIFKRTITEEVKSNATSCFMDWITEEKYYHHITGNQIHKTIIKEYPKNSARKQFSKCFHY